jgi:hypothetical protein
MPVQTSYSAAPAIGYAGQIADSSVTNVISRIANESIVAGRFVVRQAEGKCKLPAAAADITSGLALGVAMYDSSREPEAYASGDQVPVVRKGPVYVTVEAGVTEGGAVYVRHTADASLTTIGGFAPAAGTGLSLLPGARFASTALIGALAVVELNLP